MIRNIVKVYKYDDLFHCGTNTEKMKKILEII